VSAPVIITRPAPAGPRLLRRLQQGGRDAVWWPAFTLAPAPDPGQARAALARLAEFDLAIFVSPAAVQAAADLRNEPWPRDTAIGAVGAATAAAARRLLIPGDGTAVVAPAGDEAGSEAFWNEWTRRGLKAARVLILRAQHGREWLGERFAASGAAVDVVPVYTRVESRLDGDSRGRLRDWVRAGTRVLTVFSSSEAVEALDRQLAVVAEAPAWLRRGVAVATHARVAEQLLAAGYTQVELSAADDDALMARLESIQP
jgi:uroporphyrinogen-III synthase